MRNGGSRAETHNCSIRRRQARRSAGSFREMRMSMRTKDSLTFPAWVGALLLSMANVVYAAEGPYGGTPAAIPSTVQAANYDTGGQGVGYSVSVVNGSANSYRSDGVDLEVTTDTGGG